jgi:hypothetical protein
MRLCVTAGLGGIAAVLRQFLARLLAALRSITRRHCAATTIATTVAALG